MAGEDGMEWEPAKKNLAKKMIEKLFKFIKTYRTCNERFLSACWNIDSSMFDLKVCSHSELYLSLFRITSNVCNVSNIRRGLWMVYRVRSSRLVQDNRMTWNSFFKTPRLILKIRDNARFPHRTINSSMGFRGFRHPVDYRSPWVWSIDSLIRGTDATDFDFSRKLCHKW